MHPQLTMIMVNSRIDDLRAELLRARTLHRRSPGARHRRLTGRGGRWWRRRSAGRRGKGGLAFA